jgi:hypothetical protein
VGLRFKSKKPHNITNRTSYVIESRIVAVRKATGFGPEQLANLVNESLNVEDKGEQQQQQISNTTAYNILARYSLVDADKKRWSKNTNHLSEISLMN